MTSFYLNQIFYHYNKFDTQDDILLLTPYLFQPSASSSSSSSIINASSSSSSAIINAPSIINASSTPSIINAPNIINASSTSSTSSSIINSFFWCLYILHNGYASYLKIKQKYKNIELDERQKIMDYIKQHPYQIKESNIKITKIKMQEIMSDLLTSHILSISTYPILCIYYHISVYIIVQKICFYCGVSNNETKTVILEYMPLSNSSSSSSSSFYKIETNITSKKIDMIKNKYVFLDSFEKPFKGISNYKREELETMATKLEIKYEKKMKKEELFTTIRKATDCYIKLI